MAVCVCQWAVHAQTLTFPRTGLPHDGDVESTCSVPALRVVYLLYNWRTATCANISWSSIHNVHQLSRANSAVSYIKHCVKKDVAQKYKRLHSNRTQTEPLLLATVNQLEPFLYTENYECVQLPVAFVGRGKKQCNEIRANKKLLQNLQCPMRPNSSLEQCQPIMSILLCYALYS